jgi:hypothetical protein
MDILEVKVGASVFQTVGLKLAKIIYLSYNTNNFQPLYIRRR